MAIKMIGFRSDTDGCISFEQFHNVNGRIKMPRLFEFRSELPREANGKLYKRELRDEFAARAAADG